MHQHVCKRMLLHLMMKFSLMENFIFLYFHEHKNTELNYFNYISKLQNLGCYIITCGCDFFYLSIEHAINMWLCACCHCTYLYFICLLQK
jgi:hypothetical protein